MSKLKGKVAIVTGGNSGIGLATVKQYLAEGAKVVFSGRRQSALDEAAAELSGDFISVLADQSKVSDNEVLISKAVEKYGKIDVLFVNAGIAHFVPAGMIDEDHFDTHFNTNIKGPMFLVKAALPHLNDGGAIIFNTSIVHQKGFEGGAVYSATKGALRAYARVLTTELKGRQIRVNSIAPGPIATPIYDKMGMDKETMDAMGQGFASMVPLGRFGDSNEIATAAVFLASDDASYINGIELEVDGGLTQV